MADHMTETEAKPDGSLLTWIWHAYPQWLKAGMRIVGRWPEQNEWSVDREGMKQPPYIDLPDARTFVFTCASPYPGMKVYAHLSVDPATKRVIWSSDGLLDTGMQASGTYALAIVTGPVVLALAPLLLAVHAGYGVQERLAGMSRHAVALLRDVSDQLTISEFELLVETFKNEWTAAQG